MAGSSKRDLADQVMTAQEEERRRIARELHDRRDALDEQACPEASLGGCVAVEIGGFFDQAFAVSDADGSVDLGL